MNSEVPTPDTTTATEPQGEHPIWVAVDANPHYTRLVVVSDSRILGAFEAAPGPRHIQRCIDFIRKTAPTARHVRLAGRFYDPWPQLLRTALILEFGPVTWINPNILNGALPGVDRWRRMFNTYRALFFAICAEDAGKRPYSVFDHFDLLHAWKNAVVYHLMEDLEPQAVLATHPTALY
jgi:hypothetical protein